MKGYYLAQEGHVVNALPPVDITGGKTSQAISLKNWGHATLLVLIGLSAAAFNKIIVNACSDAAGDNPVAIPFNLFACETAGGDVNTGRQAILAAGYTPSANDGIFYVIELDAAELPQGSPYVQVQLTNGVNSVIASVVAVLSGGRFAGDQSATVLV